MIHSPDLIRTVISPIVDIRVGRLKRSEGAGSRGRRAIVALRGGRSRSRSRSRSSRRRRSRRGSSPSEQATTVGGAGGAGGAAVTAAPPRTAIPPGIDPFGVIVAAGINGDHGVEGGGGEGGGRGPEVEKGSQEIPFGLQGGIGRGVADGPHGLDGRVVRVAFATHGGELALDTGAAVGVARVGRVGGREGEVDYGKQGDIDGRRKLSLKNGGNEGDYLGSLLTTMKVIHTPCSSPTIWLPQRERGMHDS